ncbi:MAG: hypothetical protein AVDCRST_MAG12-2112, partial [uncultured Rubrobacteraceae bacterium]
CRSFPVRAGRSTMICDAGWASPGRRSGSCAPGAGRRPSRTWSVRSRDVSRPASRLRPSPSTCGSRASSPSSTAATSPVQTPGGLRSWSSRQGRRNALCRREGHRAEQGWR